MYSELFQLAKTQEELETLRSELTELTASLFKGEGQYELILAKKVRPQTAEVLKKLAAEGKMPDRSKYFEGALAAFDAPKVLELTVAFEPKQEGIERIWEWVRVNVGEGIVLKFGVDHSVGAGAILVFNGKYRNYSLKKKLDDYFATLNPDLTQILT